MSPPAISPKRSPSFGLREPALGVRHPGLVLEVGPVEVVELHQVARGRAARGSGRRRPGAPASRSLSRATIAREIELETSSRTTAPKRRRRSSLSTASSRSSASSEISVSPSRVTRKAARSGRSMPGKSQLRWWEITLSSGISSPRVADRDEARQRLGHLDAREALLARVGVAHRDPEAEREPRDVGERLARARPRAASAPGRSRARSAPRARARSSAVASSTRADADPLARRAPGASSSRQSFDWRRGQLERALAHLGERLLRACGRRASAR